MSKSLVRRMKVERSRFSLTCSSKRGECIYFWIRFSTGPINAYLFDCRFYPEESQVEVVNRHKPAKRETLCFFKEQSEYRAYECVVSMLRHNLREFT